MRTYLFTNSTFYENISISLLSSALGLSEKSVISVVSKMIWSEELAGSIDQTHNVIVFSKVELSKLQSLASQLSDRANSLIETNEKVLQLKLDDGKDKPDAGDLAAKARRGGRGQGTKGNKNYAAQSANARRVAV